MANHDGAGDGNQHAVLALDASRSMISLYGNQVFGGPNRVEIVARNLGSVLTELAGNVTILYWALGLGDGIEIVGDFDKVTFSDAAITGPKTEKWGRGTCLLPTIRYIAETVDQHSQSTLGVVLTDGIIEDEKECMEYCLQLGENIKKAVDAGDRPKDSFQIVMIGVGEDVDVGQLERFDDLFDDTPLAGEVDLFSSNLAAHMQDVNGAPLFEL
ncbi:MAG: hypothetical protein KDA84_21655 [Planctomycetaceae bacterium]|nr:hypothetical protein [Planctomycetaceae bacterium]